MLKIIKSDLDRIAALPSQYPEEDLPEIAFAGRSNVGKSSFINAVLNRKNLARTSSKPGKTRTVNFYLVNEEFRFVDLPGYGYAAVSKNEKEKWAGFIEDYLNTRNSLREVILLVDIRHEPTNQDLQMYEWIRAYGFTGYIIATKADKISRGQYQKALKKISLKLGADISKIIPFSAKSKSNMDCVLDMIESIIKQ
ncbi:MAG: ribosome biogenesis GTP-binding protein YihA/YsxC [Tissierellia bacterium]|nr:ribosome biogenesis GTP-binding protein YihA/YsxC [Tissierellia bacterium]